MSIETSDGDCLSASNRSFAETVGFLKEVKNRSSSHFSLRFADNERHFCEADLVADDHIRDVKFKCKGQRPLGLCFLDDRKQGVVVANVKANSVAFDSHNVVTGDVVYSVCGWTVKGLPFRQVIHMIRNEWTHTSQVEIGFVVGGISRRHSSKVMLHVDEPKHVLKFKSTDELGIKLVPLECGPTVYGKKSESAAANMPELRNGMVLCAVNTSSVNGLGLKAVSQMLTEAKRHSEHILLAFTDPGPKVQMLLAAYAKRQFHDVCERELNAQTFQDLLRGWRGCIRERSTSDGVTRTPEDANFILQQTGILLDTLGTMLISSQGEELSHILARAPPISKRVSHEENAASVTDFRASRQLLSAELQEKLASSKSTRALLTAEELDEAASVMTRLTEEDFVEKQEAALRSVSKPLAPGTKF